MGDENSLKRGTQKRKCGWQNETIYLKQQQIVLLVWNISVCVFFKKKLFHGYLLIAQGTESISQY